MKPNERGGIERAFDELVTFYSDLGREAVESEDRDINPDMLRHGLRNFLLGAGLAFLVSDRAENAVNADFYGSAGEIEPDPITGEDLEEMMEMVDRRIDEFMRKITE